MREMYYLLKGEIIFHQKYQLKEVKTMKKIIVVVVIGSLIAGTSPGTQRASMLEEEGAKD